jgi:glycosyltransferase involved in cell wall biosynthesis
MTTSQTQLPLVSIVTPAYNAAPYLRQLIESVLTQSYGSIEHIVIDDGSTDNGATVAILRDFPHVRWWSRKNIGQYATMNEGFTSARGEIITTISADDYYVDRHAIRDVVDCFRTQPSVEIVFGTTLHVDHSGTPLPVQPYQGYPVSFLPYNLFVSHCSLFVRTERLRERSLWFDLSYRYIADADWLVRLFRAGLPYARLKRPIAAYRHHPIQTSQQVGRSAATAARDADDRRRFKSEFADHPMLQASVDTYVNLHHRSRMALHALRSGGPVRLVKESAAWLRRRVSR